MTPSTKYFLIAFAIGACALIPALRHYYRRNPHPKMRPRFGEMVLVSLLGFGLVGGTSFMLTSLFTDADDMLTGIEKGGMDHGTKGAPSQKEKEKAAKKSAAQGDD